MHLSVLLLAALGTLCSAERVLVLFDNPKIKETHSIFFKAVSGTLDHDSSLLDAFQIVVIVSITRALMIQICN